MPLEATENGPIPDVLAFIQLAATKGDIYDPAVDASVQNLILHNTNTTTETIELLYDDGTNEYQMWKMDLVANETVQIDFLGRGDIIKAAGKITGNTTTASKVTCKIIGVED